MVCPSHVPSYERDGKHNSDAKVSMVRATASLGMVVP